MVDVKDARLLIVGAGPTGLTVGVELARRGIIPEIIDKKPKASTLSRAVGILPRSLEILEPSGVTDRLISEGITVTEIGLYRGTKNALSFSLKGGHPKRDYVIALAQDRTEAALHEKFVELGGSVEYNCKLEGLSQDPDSVVVSYNGESHEYDYVIAADGIRSFTRESVGIDFVGFDLPETWSIADVDAVEWADAKRFIMCLLPKGEVVVVVPLEANRFRVISNTENALASLPLNMDIQNIRREGNFTISIRQAASYSKGRVFLAGDAAHCHSPAGGRGMNLGIADAAELAERFAKDSLSGYSKSRHLDGEKTIAASERLRKAVTSTNPFARGTLIAGAALFSVIPPAKRILARQFLGD